MRERLDGLGETGNGFTVVASSGTVDEGGTITFTNDAPLDSQSGETNNLTLNAGTMHFRSGAKCPLVLRFPCGGGLTFGSFHSQELESFLLSMPGLKGLYPSTPQDAFNALLAAYEVRGFHGGVHPSAILEPNQCPQSSMSSPNCV